MPKYADPAVYPVGTPAATDNVMTRTAAGADGNFALGNLAGIAGLTPSTDLSLYYNGTAWATYTVTSVGRTLLAATTQAAQRTALGLGDAAVQNIGTSGATVPLLNGTNTWGATQTFSVSPVFSAGLIIPSGQALMLGATTALLSGGGGITVLAGAGAATSLIFRPNGSGSTTGQVTVNADGTTSFTNIVIASGGFRPTTDNTADVGTGAIRIRTYYGVNSAINTSDARLKTEPRKLSEAERGAGSELARLPAIWEWLTGDRLHAGPTVQAAMAVMAAHELDPFAYSFICYDEWEAEPATYDDEGNELTPAREAGDRYSFRKEELLCFMVAALAAENDLQAAKVEALDARLAVLEAKA